ncbi:hypothetical protein B0H11DRAFT_803192 [Mycena galericulata]|nr:hypothetical protein B0H11DRAFT_803192 [Mycena galericulata]
MLSNVKSLVFLALLSVVLPDLVGADSGCSIDGQYVTAYMDKGCECSYPSDAQRQAGTQCISAENGKPKCSNYPTKRPRSKCEVGGPRSESRHTVDRNLGRL